MLKKLEERAAGVLIGPDTGLTPGDSRRLTPSDTGLSPTIKTTGRPDPRLGANSKSCRNAE